MTPGARLACLALVALAAPAAVHPAGARAARAPLRPTPAAAAPAAPIPAHRELLEDGTELIVLPIRNVQRASLRYVVRAGSAYDPPGADGLAHVLEHVVAGVRDRAEPLMDDVGVAGGDMNAFTSHEATVYTLDAPSSAFLPLAERLVAAVTNPQLDRALISREQGVVDSEDDGSRGRGPLGVAEDVIFRAPGSTLGAGTTRANITREELAAFFRQRYLTTATTLVFAGDVTPEAARAVVERAFHLPPAIALERSGARAADALLPVNDEVRAPFNAAIVGYRIDEADRATCGALAELVGLRLAFALQVKRPVLGGSSVACRSLRGNLFLLAFAYSRELDSADVPTLVDQAFRRGAEAPMTRVEQQVLEQRRSRRSDALRESPEGLAAAAAALAALPREGGPTPLELLDPPTPAPAKVQDLARRAFQPGRRVSVSVSPLGN